VVVVVVVCERITPCRASSVVDLVLEMNELLLDVTLSRRTATFAWSPLCLS